MKCWGSKATTAVGDGTETERYAPVTVHSSAVGSTALSGVSAIAGGEHHTCALLAGTVKCWAGQAWPGRRRAKVICRYGHSPARLIRHVECPLRCRPASHRRRVRSDMRAPRQRDGQVLGANFLGEVGDGTTTQRKAPVTVKAGGGSSVALSNVVAIAAGGFYTCALLVNGTVMCWGTIMIPRPVVGPGPGSSTA